MRVKVLIVFVLLLSLNIPMTYGQWDAQLSQYWKVKNYYNPSFIGETNAIDASLLHRIQWVGIDNAPRTSVVTAHMPFEFLGKSHAVGLLVMNESIGLFSNTATNLQYAYKFRFKKNRTLSVGVQLAMTNIDFDAGKIRVSTSDEGVLDPDIPSGGSDMAFDGGLGVSWTTPDYYVGLSVSHLAEPKFELDETHASYISRGYYLMGGYFLELSNPLFEFQPSAFFKADEVVTQMEFTAKMEYKKLFSGGISWRKDDGFVFLLGAKIKGIEAGYAYDLSTSEISKASSGSHELFLRYIVPLDKKKSLGKQKSIRIL